VTVSTPPDLYRLLVQQTCQLQGFRAQPPLDLKVLRSVDSWNLRQLFVYRERDASTSYFSLKANLGSSPFNLFVVASKGNYKGHQQAGAALPFMLREL
jgi:hypothetical protein